jgi:hypothetical protein
MPDASKQLCRSPKSAPAYSTAKWRPCNGLPEILLSIARASECQSEWHGAYHRSFFFAISDYSYRPTVNENSVPPLLIAEYLKRVNRFWPCFCSRNTDEHDAVSCRLVIMLRTTTVAVCHYNPPRCQFFRECFVIQCSYMHILLSCQ